MSTMLVPMVMLVLLIASFQGGRVAAISLTISPDHVRITKGPQSVSFTCSADVALAGCQFSWWDDVHGIAGPLLELSRGSQSQVDPDNVDLDSLTSYNYSGEGLGAGDCGVTLQAGGFKRWMVACRVRAVSGGWKYAWADLVAFRSDPVIYNVTTPREVVVLPGGEARISLKAREPLYWCSFHLLSVSQGEVYFHQGAKSANSTGRHLYRGAGLQSGECGLALTVSEKDNGLVTGYIDALTYRDDFGFIALVVARPPTAPTLTLTYTDTNVTATCEVQESRPVAKISWVLGDNIIRQDEDDDTQAGPQDEWRWPWMQGSIKQTLTLQLQPKHIGKILKCRVSHIALAQPLEAKKTISL